MKTLMEKLVELGHEAGLEMIALGNTALLVEDGRMDSGKLL